MSQETFTGLADEWCHLLIDSRGAIRASFLNRLQMIDKVTRSAFWENRLYFRGTLHEARIKEVSTISVNPVSVKTYFKLKQAFCGRNTKEEKHQK